MHQDSPRLRISALAKRSGVPSATIKHYVREGLFPAHLVHTRRNTAEYDVSLVERIKAIKELQRTRFLPLRVIKGVLDRTTRGADAETAAAIARVLAEMSPHESRSRAEIVASGVPAAELDFFESLGVISAIGAGKERRYEGDDVELLRTLGAARKAGLTAEMLPAEILRPYAHAIHELVRLELLMFRQGVLPRAGAKLGPLTDAATRLSERLVVTLRRKMLLPTLQQLVLAESMRKRKRKEREQ
jgi:DNA-binding transcriptional MerR regulator